MTQEIIPYNEGYGLSFRQRVARQVAGWRGGVASDRGCDQGTPELLLTNEALEQRLGPLQELIRANGELTQKLGKGQYCRIRLYGPTGSESLEFRVGNQTAVDAKEVETLMLSEHVIQVMLTPDQKISSAVRLDVPRMVFAQLGHIEYKAADRPLTEYGLDGLSYLRGIGATHTATGNGWETQVLTDDVNAITLTQIFEPVNPIIRGLIPEPPTNQVSSQLLVID